MSFLKRLFIRPAAMPMEVATAIEDPRYEALRRWLAEEVAPPYAWEDLVSLPDRLEAARLLAEGSDLAAAEAPLARLEKRGDCRVDRMLRADVWLREGEFERAVALLRELAAGEDAIAARAAMLLGEIRYDHGEFADAIALAERASRLAPRAFGCLLLLAGVRAFQGRHEEALELHRRALESRPQSLLAIGLLAVALMGRGQLQAGLAVYAAADDLLGAYPRADLCPVWTGQALAGKRLLVIGAYGYGDVMMFLRFVAQLREREAGVRLSIDVPPPLARLMQATGWFEQVYAGAADRAAADFQVSTMRLPLVLGTQEADVARHDACLAIAPEDVAAAAHWLRPRRAGEKRVGLRWFGRPMHFDAKRSVPFEYLAPLFRVPGIDWVALVEEEGMLQKLGVHPLSDVSGHLTDFYATGAVMKNLDLVISVDTSTVHLGGALGVPTWLIARPDYEWRWGEGGQEAPWYSSVRVFRHPPRQLDWEAVMAGMAQALAAWARA
ncbi:MAG TPA: hypothetical protein VGN52_18395 [Burkholderiales bacterium]